MKIRDAFRKLRWILPAVFAAWIVCLVAIAFVRARLDSPPATFLLLDRRDRFLAETGSRDGEFGYWPLQTAPPRVAAATIALEDRRFWQHPGVDGFAVLRAMTQNARSFKRISGASTLGMQIARMQHPGGRTYQRKLVEAITALFLTYRYGRSAILLHYLQIVPYGNRIHGIAYAARRYFDKPVEDLSWAEISFLAALPQAPARMNPFEPEGMTAAIKRGRRVLDSLYGSGVLSTPEYRLAAQQLSAFRMPEPGRRDEESLHAILHVEKILLSHRSEFSSHIIRTTIDPDIQHETAWMAWKSVKSWEKYGAGNAAAIVLDRNTNEVLAWIGSTDYFDEKHAGSLDYTQIERSSGSTLKPFLFALALEQGNLTPATILDDLHRAEDGISNADDRFLGPMLPRAALANSRNVTAVDVLHRAGLDASFAMLGELGLHNGSAPARRYGAGLAVGGLPVTLERLVRAYSALARGGQYGELQWFRGRTSQSRRVMSEETAREITLFLSDPLARLPSFPRMGNTEFSFPVAVKTGTSYAHRDAWTVAYSTRYVVGVWVGHPNYVPMNRLSGYRAAAQLTQQILLYLHKDEAAGLQDVSFPPPRGYIPRRICALTGQLAKPECDRVSLEWFRPGTEPVEYCRAHYLEAIDARNGLAATATTPKDSIEIRRTVNPGPRYAVWSNSLELPSRAEVQNASWRPSDRESQISLVQPVDGLHIQQDPETPAGLATLALEATVDPAVKQVLWYVDGAPFQIVEYPYSTRWPLQKGTHTFRAAIPYTNITSKTITVAVRQ